MKKLEFTIKGNKYSVHIKDVEDNIAHIEVNGTEYAVEIHQEVKKTKTPKLVRKDVVKKPGEGTITKSTGGSTLKAPLPGSIFKIMTSEGDEVKKGQNLLIMEAMKMENDIRAEKDGVIKSLKVKVGDAVLQGDVLVEFE
ncbi:biotin/lipoyl-containing protein [Saccharicrinis sp. FJH2]|uniref:biotin/lipoyl-containing protein n=1 Tax=Saccharicrinis sp. FJH65 TaxID=3344659 RepID=UPI0035F25C66